MNLQSKFSFGFPVISHLIHVDSKFSISIIEYSVRPKWRFTTFVSNNLERKWQNRLFHNYFIYTWAWCMWNNIHSQMAATRCSVGFFHGIFHLFLISFRLYFSYILTNIIQSLLACSNIVYLWYISTKTSSGPDQFWLPINTVEFRFLGVWDFFDKNIEAKLSFVYH